MLKRLICLIGALVGAAGLSQAPEYTQQYAQRLAGAVDELTAVADQFDADAASMGLTRQEGLGRYGASADGFLAGRGLAMQTVFERHAQLSAQLAQLRAASPATRLFELSRSFDTDVGKAALEDFRPAMPLTAEASPTHWPDWASGLRPSGSSSPLSPRRSAAAGRKCA